MPKIAEELGALAVSRLSTAKLHFVGGVPGLALAINENGARSWVLRVKVGEKRRGMGLGSYPAVTLAQARDKARAARDLIRQGVDPIEQQRAAHSALLASQAAAQTFEQCAAAYIKAHQPGWKNAKHGWQWRRTLEQFAYPVIGKMLVADIDTPQIVRILEPMWDRTPETAKRLRNRVELVLDWATARKYRSGVNPARWKGHLDKLLHRHGKLVKKHQPAVQVAESGAFIKQLRQNDSVSARALEFVMLTATRSGEVRGAKWSEIDLNEKVWIVPAERMKEGKEHRVPLSDAAVDLLRKIPRFDADDTVFQARRGGPLSNMAMNQLMRGMEFYDRDGRKAVPHGCRSTFRDWASDWTNYPREVAEMALAHAIDSKVEAAYRRGDLFDKRRRLMQDWANFLSQPMTKSAAIIPLHGAA